MQTIYLVIITDYFWIFLDFFFLASHLTNIFFSLTALSDPYSFEEAKSKLIIRLDDNISTELITPSAEDYQTVLETLDRFEELLKQRSLNTLIETKEGDTASQLYDEWQTELTQMENEKKQFLRNAQTARKKINEARKS